MGAEYSYELLVNEDDPKPTLSWQDYHDLKFEYFEKCNHHELTREEEQIYNLRLKNLEIALNGLGKQKPKIKPLFDPRNPSASYSSSYSHGSSHSTYAMGGFTNTCNMVSSFH